MHKILASTIAMLALAVPAIAQEPGDVVTLKNGDRLSGTVKSITADGVVVETAATGEVTVTLAEVQNIATRGAIDLASDSGERMQAQIQGYENGTLRIGSGAAVRDVSASTLVRHRPPVEWTGSFNVGGSLSTGNTERRAASAAGEVVRRTDDTRLTLRGTWDYGQDKPTGTTSYVLTQRRTFGSAKFDYFVYNPLYVYGETSATNDVFAALKLRLTAGLGLGYQFFDTDTFSLSGEAGASYIDDTRYPPAMDNEYLAARLSYNLRWGITESTELLQTAEFFPSLENKDDYYGRLDTRVRTSLTDTMFAQLQWIFDYDNTAPPANDKQDHRLILGIGWSF